MRELTAFVAEPRATLFDDAFFEGEIEERTCVRNAFVIHDVELGFGEGRGDLVFHDLDLCAVARNCAVPVLDRTDAADIDADAGVKFEGFAAGCGLGIAKHHADFFTNLVSKEADRIRFRNE